MSDIRLGLLGQILTGREVGRIVEVVDDSDNTGGFLIFTYADEHRSPEVFDAWVSTLAEVDSYFRESNWTIRWLETQAGP